jgi:hypothetical protein
LDRLNAEPFFRPDCITQTPGYSLYFLLNPGFTECNRILDTIAVGAVLSIHRRSLYWQPILKADPRGDEP